MHQKATDELAIAAAQRIEEEKYWLNQLSGEPVKSCFPTDYNKRPKLARTFEEVKSVIPGDLFARLMQIVKDSDVRLYTTTAAGVILLLYKYTYHQEDITVGTSIYRQETDTRFINTILPLRNQLFDHMIFKEFLMQVGQVIFEAHRHQNYPVEELLQLLNIPFSKDEDFPLFDTAVLLENLHDKRYLETIHLNVIFVFKRTHSGIEVTVEYNSLLYKRTTIRRIISHFFNLLKNAVNKPTARLCHIETLSEENRREILFDFNDTKTPYSSDKTLHQLFREQVHKTPDNIALTFNGKALNYTELNNKTNQLAWELRKRGVKPNKFAAVVMDRSIEMVIGVMAILKADGAYVPLEPHLPETRIITCLSSLEVEWLLTNQLQLNKMAKIKEKLPGLRHIFCLDEVAGAGSESLKQFEDSRLILAQEIEKNQVENLTPAARAADIAYVIFTSGTTGIPKGVVEQHRPVVNIIQWVNKTFQVSGADKLLFVASLSFDLSVYDIFGLLAAGGAIRVAGKDDLKSPDRLLDIIFEEGITFWDSAPAALQQIVLYLRGLADTHTRWPGNKSKLRLVFLSGDWIPVSMPDFLKEFFKGVEVIALGGATEATIWSNFYPIHELDPDWISIPYGKPIQNAKYYILDKSLNPCPIGVPGDLYIGGLCLAAGYINDIRLTAGKFIDNPFVDGEIIYRTGDLSRWFPDGNMEFLGRRDNQVKIRGFRIELGEIESQLIMHEQIKAAVVEARGETKTNQYLCAYYVAENLFEADELTAFLSKSLPDYMIPPYFVRLDKLPITPNGKLDRKALPEPGAREGALVYTPPRDQVDEKIITIWSGIIGIEEDKIGIDSNFFELGGHSLNATSMISKIHKEFNVRIAFVDVFTKPTVKDLSDFIKKGEENIYASVQTVEEKEYYPVSAAQKRMFLLNRIKGNNVSDNTPEVYQVEGNLHKERLQNILKMMIQRHESFRTSFKFLGDLPIQKVHKYKDVDFKLEYSEVSNPGVDSAREVEEIIADFIHPFDLSIPPLLRVGLVKLPGERYMLMYDIHHIIRDIVSTQIFMKEFIHLYEGKKLSPLRIQYKDFASWQNTLLESGAAGKQEEYWLNVFPGELPVLNLPLDYPRPPVQSFVGDYMEFELDDLLTKKIKTLMEESKTTFYMMMLTMYNILLSKYCGQEDVVVGAPAVVRPHVDLENVIGIFVNTLAMRNYPRQEKTFWEFLSEVKSNTLNAFENQGYQFEDLVSKLGIKPNPGRNPLFDTMLAGHTIDVNVDMEGPVTQMKDLVFTPYGFENKVTQYDILVHAVDGDNRITFQIRFSTALFKPETIEKFFDYFKEIAAAVTDNKYIQLKDIKISLDFVDSSSDILAEAKSNFAF